MYIRKLATVVALFPLLVACGSAPDGGGPTPAPTPAPTSPADPSAAPQVVAATPSNGAGGVELDAVIELRFSKPMAKASVEGAYASTALPKDAVAFSWNAAGDTLTITPNKGIPYAEGAPDVAPLAFDVRIGAAATDTTGKAMAADFVLSFSSMRRITHHVPTVPNLTGRVLATGAGSAGSVGVGDVLLLGAEPSVRGFVTFDLSAVPDARLESAMLTLKESSMSGNPDADLGGLKLQQLSFSALDMAAYMTKATNGPTISRVLDAKGPVRQADVRGVVAADLADRVARQNRTQVRLTYGIDSDKDGQSDQLMLDGSADLAIVYVTP
jgi:hypothetical protein